jgi:hypothetical protein
MGAGWLLQRATETQRVISLSSPISPEESAFEWSFPNPYILSAGGIPPKGKKFHVVLLVCTGEGSEKSE